MDEGCDAWSGELADDSLKSMFMGVQALKDGNRIESLAILEAQVRERIPDIEKRAIAACESAPCYNVRPLENDFAVALRKIVFGHIQPLEFAVGIDVCHFIISTLKSRMKPSCYTPIHIAD